MVLSIFKWHSLTFQSIDFGNIFSTIGVRELQPRASEVFTKFGEIHRQMEQYGVSMIKKLKPVSLALNVCNEEK